MSQPMMLLRNARRDPNTKHEAVDRQTWRRIASYAKGMRWSLVVFCLLAVWYSFQELIGAFALRGLVDRGFAGSSRNLMLFFVALVAGVELLRVVLDIFLRWLSAVIGERLIHELRQELYEKIQSLPIAFHTHSATGALQSRISADVVSAKDAFTSVLRNVVVNSLVLVGNLWGMLYLSWQVTLLGLALVPIALIPTRYVSAKIRKYSELRMAASARMQTHLGDRFNVGGALLVKLFGDQHRERHHFSQLSGEVRDLGVKAATVQKLYLSLFGITSAIATAIVYTVGGLQLLAGELTIGTILAMAVLIVRLYAPVTSLAGARVDLVTSALSFQRVFEVLDFDGDFEEPKKPTSLPSGPLELRMDGVSFAYPAASDSTPDSLAARGAAESALGGMTNKGRSRGITDKQETASGTCDTTTSRSRWKTTTSAALRLVLDDISLTIRPGEIVAIVGPSGSGKSTIAQLLCRLYDPTSGTISLGGVDLRECSLAELHERISMVPQESHMFQTSIAQNLRYAKPDADDAELAAVIEQANLTEFVQRLPDGLETQVGSRGYRLSGGEKQRLAIARLLLRAPDIVVLDESTAHLDSLSEHKVQAAMDAALRGRAAVVIAHRLSTIRNADQIIVVDRGRVCERGTHDELIALGGKYADLSATQDSGLQPGG